MTRRRLLRFGLTAVAMVVVAGAATFWWVFLRDDTPSEAALVDREVVADPVGELDGTWAVQGGRDVWAGYRIDEHLSALDNTAVARTRDVEGTLTVVGTEVTEVAVEVDMTTLTSEDDQVPAVGNRDEAMRTKALETDTFPAASFTLTEPIELGELPEPGDTITVEAVGEVDLHGVTRTVTVPLQARWNGEVVDLTASLDVALADYDIEQPAAQIVTVADQGTLELQLTFARER